MRILLIDDSAVDREIIGGIFHEVGIDVMEAEDGSTARLMFSQTTPCVIFLDWSLKRGMTGLDLLRTIRRDPTKSGTPVIVMLGIPSADQEKSAWKEGASWVWVKKNDLGAFEREFRIMRDFVRLRAVEHGHTL